MRQNESRLVLAIQIAAQLQRGIALSAIHEYRDSGQQVADRHLTAGKDRRRRNAELRLTALAFEYLAALVLVDRETAASRANGFAIRIGPPDTLECLVSLGIRQAQNLGQ